MRRPRGRWLALTLGAGGVALTAYQVARYRRSAAARFAMEDAPAPGSAAFASLIDSLTGATLRPGNRVEIMRNGVTLQAMLSAVRSARKTIDFSSYIYWPGSIADQFTEALVERAWAGVDVNMVVDAYGSAKLDRAHLERLEEGGVHVVRFRSPHWYSLNKLNNRMHRRVLVVDGRIGFAGGVGIADVWTGNAEDPGHWRETHLRIEGPAVRDLFGAFVENWAEATAGLPTGTHIPPVDGFQDGACLQVTRSTPTGGRSVTTLLFYAAIAGARRSVWLTTAYFAPDPGFVDVLCVAAGRGVDVRILVNGQEVDKEVMRRAGQRTYDRLLAARVRIFEYNRTMLHAKVLIVDGRWANVGTSNFDARSFDHDLELNVALSDAACVGELERHFLEDLEHSSEFDLTTWRNRPLRKRLAEYATTLTRQSL